MGSTINKFDFLGFYLHPYLKLLKNILQELPIPLTKPQFKDWIVLNTNKKFKIK